MNFYEKYSGYHEILNHLNNYSETLEDIIVTADDNENLDFDEKMDELEKVLDDNDVLLGEIKNSLQVDFVEQLRKVDTD